VLRDSLEIARLHEGPVGDVASVLEEVSTVLAEQYRIGEHAVVQRVYSARSIGTRFMPCISVPGAQNTEIKRRGAFGVLLGNDAAQSVDAEAAKKVEVVHGGERIATARVAWIVSAGAVAEVGGALGLVEGRPGVH
jgi:hypothetical protein